MKNRLKSYLKSQKLYIIITTVCTTLSFWWLTSSTNIRMDTDVFSYDPESMIDMWLRVGRFGLVIVKYLLFLTSYHPVRSGVCFILFFVLSFITVGYFLYDFSEETDYPYWMFFLLYGTSHIWAYQVYFVLQEAEIGFVCWMTSLLAGVMVKSCFYRQSKRKNNLVFALSFLGLILCFATYQSFVFYYVAICLVYFVFLSYHQGMLKIQPNDSLLENRKSIFLGCLRLVVHFSLAFFVYWLIANKLFLSNSQYLAGQMKWGSTSVVQCLTEIKYEIGSVIRLRDQGHFSYYPLGMLMAFYGMFLVFVQKKKFVKGYWIWIELGMLGILLIPFGIQIALGGLVSNRLQFCLQISAAFFPLFFYVVYTTFEDKKNKIIRFVLYFSCVCVAVIQMGINVKLYITDQERYLSDCEYAESMGGVLAPYAHREKPVVFLGIHRAEETSVVEKSGDYGYSFFEWENSVIPPDANAAGICRFFKAYMDYDISVDYSEEMLMEACEYGLMMSSFPQENSVLETDDYVIIKLSDFED